MNHPLSVDEIISSRPGTFEDSDRTYRLFETDDPAVAKIGLPEGSSVSQTCIFQDA
jgi:hypothetical protein